MSILIKNGSLYDGTGQPSSKQDVLIKGKLIAEVGDIKSDDFDVVINARGKVVAPGFIDINSSSDHHFKILSDPKQKDPIKQGVTTVICGNSGISLAPFSSGMDDLLSSEGTNITDFNVDWNDFGEFLESIEKRGSGVNFGSLAGYYSLKEFATGDRFKRLDKKDLSLLKENLSNSLDSGALGLSFGLDLPYSRSLKKKEIKELSNLVKRGGGVVAGSLRSGDNEVSKSFDEILNIVKGSGVNFQINNLQPVKSKVKEYKEGKNKVEELSKSENLNFDCHPYQVVKTPIYKFLPRDVRDMTFAEMLDFIKNPENEKKLVEYLKSKTRKGMTILHTPPEFKFYEKKTLKDISENMNLNQAETLFKLMKVMDLQGLFLYSDVNKNTLNDFLFSKTSIIGSNGIHLERADYKPFSEFISLSLKNDFPLEKAVAKITSVPARKYRLKKRGMIKKGYYGDVTILNKNKISDVLINGEVVMREGEFQGSLAGRILRGN